ncbi:MAG: IclR family transcriptional regulator, partial [Alphaproteobacteria bacterium]
AFARSRNFVPMAKIFMRHLMDKAGETVNLATQDHEDIVYLAQVECKEMMRAFVRPGLRAPMHCSAVGKAIMSAMPEVERSRMISLQGVGHNSHQETVYTPEFLTTLENVRQCGYALDDEEQSIGMRCVASVVYDENGGPLAAVSISGPTARITDKRIPILGKLVQQTCLEITANFGGRPSTDVILP